MALQLFFLHDAKEYSKGIYREETFLYIQCKLVYGTETLHGVKSDFFSQCSLLSSATTNQAF